MINRRQFIKLLNSHALAFPAVLSPNTFAADKNKNDKFILYVHFGSADGLTTGMLQPKEVVVDGSKTNLPITGKWQKGLFWLDDEVLADSAYADKQNYNAGHSINPNVNIHYKDANSSLIFNEYSKVLLPIQNHLCCATGNSMSLSHHDAASFQISGDRFGSNSGSWVAKLAQATNESKFTNVVFSPKIGSRESVYSKIFSERGTTNSNVALIGATDLDSMYNILSDTNDIPLAESDARAFWQVLKQLNTQQGRYPSIRESANFYIDNLLAGAPEFSDSSPMRTEIEQNINLAKCKEIIKDSSLPNGGVCDVPDSFFQQNAKLIAALQKDMQLAAGLALSKKTKGMMFSYGDHDYHSGGSSYKAPRHASVLFATVRLFWELIKSKNLQDDVMVIISHDFTRTTYNGKEKSDKKNLQHRTANGINNINFTEHGNDHMQIMSMMFLNSKVPTASRVGGIYDNYTAFGSKDGRGVPVQSISPYVAQTLVGTMLMRCFDDVFVDEKTTNEFLPNFEKPIAWLLK